MPCTALLPTPSNPGQWPRACSRRWLSGRSPSSTFARSWWTITPCILMWWAQFRLASSSSNMAWACWLHSWPHPLHLYRVCWSWYHVCWPSPLCLTAFHPTWPEQTSSFPTLAMISCPAWSSFYHSRTAGMWFPRDRCCVWMLCYMCSIMLCALVSSTRKHSASSHTSVRWGNPSLCLPHCIFEILISFS